MKDLTKAAAMAAIVFVLTYTLKIPVALTGGYTHLGDCAIFIAVAVLGRKQGAIAGALGAMMADLIGGFFLWVVPTFAFKWIMASIAGLFMEKLLAQKSYGLLVGSVLGGLSQIVCYTAFKVYAISPTAAFATIPNIAIQTTVGIVVSTVVIRVFITSGVMKRLEAM